MVSPLHTQKSGRLLAITYHYVRDKGGKYPGIHPVTPEELAQQIATIKKKLHPATVNEVESFVRGENKLDRDSFFITFDDGLQDHFVSAREVLNNFELKGAFFIPTRPLATSKAPAVHKIHWLRANIEPNRFVSMINNLLPAPWSKMELNDTDRKRAAEMHIHDEPAAQALKFALNFLIPYEVVDQVTSKMLQTSGMTEAEFCRLTFMSAEQIRTLAAEGHVIGLHGHDHAPLSLYDDSRQYLDIQHNQSLLKQVTGYSPTWLSYPYGRPDALPKNAASICTRYGIELAFTLVSGFNEEGVKHSALRRITPNELEHYIPSFS